MHDVSVRRIHSPLTGVRRRRCGLLSKFFDHLLSILNRLQPCDFTNFWDFSVIRIIIIIITIIIIIEAIEVTQEIGRRITVVTEDTRETDFLFQRLSMALQRGNAVSFQNTMITE